MAERLDSAWRARPRWWPALPAGALALAALLVTSRAGTGTAATTAPAADTRALSAAQKAAVEATVRDYILSHPEIIPQAIAALEQRSVAKLLATNRAELEKPYAGAWAGAANADVVLVEFSDFACPYCRAAKATVDQLLTEDRRLKVVFRDFPVIAPASEEAALAALSAAGQGPARYRAFRDAMFGDPGRVGHEKVVAVVRRAGLDEARTARDLNGQAGRAAIARNIELGRALGLSGTPSYVVGDRVLIGAQSLDELRAAVAAARARPPSAS